MKTVGKFKITDLYIIVQPLFESSWFKLGENARYANVELDLTSVDDMYLCSEKGMRGGVFQTYKRCRKVNNKYLSSYDPKKTMRVIYLDANNLYYYVMSKILPKSYKV